LSEVIEEVAMEQRKLEAHKNKSGFLAAVTKGILESQSNQSHPVNKWIKYDTIKLMLDELPDQTICFFVDNSVLTIKHNKIQFRNRLQFTAALFNFG
jgi:hypothetical protein